MVIELVNLIGLTSAQKISKACFWVDLCGSGQHDTEDCMVPEVSKRDHLVPKQSHKGRGPVRGKLLNSQHPGSRGQRESWGKEGRLLPGTMAKISIFLPEVVYVGCFLTAMETCLTLWLSY